MYLATIKKDALFILEENMNQVTDGDAPEVDTNIEPDASQEVQVEEPGEPSAPEQDSTKEDRLDKHPRFRELTSQNRTFKAKIAEYEAKLKQFEESKSQQPEAKVNQEPDFSEVDAQIDEYFASAGKPSLKENYQNVEELYRDVRRNIYRDMLVAKRSSELQQQDIDDKNVKEITDQLDAIEKDLGPEEYEVFREFVQAATKNADEVGKVLDLGTLHTTYLAYREKLKGAPKQAVVKPGSKVSKNSAKPVAPTAKASAEYISKSDWDDLVSDAM